MASTVLSKTFTASNRKTFTISTWIKRTGLASNYGILGSGTNSSTDRDSLYFESNDYLYFDAKVSSSVVASFQTNRTFKDVGAFYHIVLAFDTTQATDTNRMKLYVNGELQTFSSVTYPNQNRDMNTNNTAHTIGAILGPVYYFDGLMSYFAFTDGTAYDASYFGETDSSSGIWKIKTSPSVTYGTNGFFLKMDTSSPGTDTSGNTNTFTAAGTPTLAQDNASNNFATWNPQINNGITGNWLNGNTTIAPNGDTPNLYAPVTIPVSKGKWYSEHMITGGNGHGSLGLAGASNIAGMFKINFEPGETSPSFAFKCINGSIKMNGSNTTYGSAPGTSDAILGMAVDIDNKKVWYSINGTYVTYGGGVGNPASGTYGFDWSSLSDDFGWLIICGDSEVSGYGNWKSNFGNGFFGTTAVASSNADAAGHGLFEYAVPTGYYTLNTKNLNTYG